jgi:hypothetical protein
MDSAYTHVNSATNVPSAVIATSSSAGVAVMISDKKTKNINDNCRGRVVVISSSVNKLIVRYDETVTVTATEACASISCGDHDKK